MYFFKNTSGNWVLGSETTSFTSKTPCTLRRDTPTVVTVMTIEKTPVLLIDKIEVTAIKKNAEGDFYANYAEFVAAVSDFFDNAPITAEEVDAKIGAEVDILSDRIDTVEGIANSASSGSLGSIKPTDAAPTPARNGNYTFSIGGNKPAWLTAEAGVTEVKAGDGVSVVYTAPSGYSYTHVDMASGSITTKELKNWFIDESYEITGTITYDSKGNINTPISILWVSGATGVLNVTRDSNGNATTWNATHILEGITKTITQPTVTRDSLGNITIKPAITIA